MTERVLVTGAGGFLGSHICHYMGRQGHIIAAVGRFSLLPEMLEFYPNLWKLCGMSLPDESFVQVVREFQPTLLIHCAGVASVPESVQNPHKHFQRTVDICAFTLDTVRQNAPECRFVLMSSAAVYGNPKSLPIDENTDCRPISPNYWSRNIRPCTEST
jgi:UDP-glucose 4-epimerase